MADEVVVYWRPACGFCAALRRQLDRLGLPYRAVNIWEDDEARAWVRSVADGNETVPTVRVADRALVNPSAAEVLALVGAAAPDLVPPGVEVPSARPQGRVGRLVARLLGGGDGTGSG